MSYFDCNRWSNYSSFHSIRSVLLAHQEMSVKVIFSLVVSSLDRGFYPHLKFFYSMQFTLIVIILIFIYLYYCCSYYTTYTNLISIFHFLKSEHYFWYQVYIVFTSVLVHWIFFNLVISWSYYHSSVYSWTRRIWDSSCISLFTSVPTGLDVTRPYAHRLIHNQMQQSFVPVQPL